MLFPSGAQIGMFPPPPRGAALSPKTLAPTSQSKAAGEISRLRVLHQIHHPQIGLGIGIDRLRRRRDERDLLPIGAEGKAARVHVDRRQFRGLAATRRNGIKFRLRPLVVRLVVMERREINLRPIFRPKSPARVEAAARQLSRLHFLVRAPRSRHDPDVLGPFEIVIAFIVPAIDRAGHDLNVAFALRFRLRLFHGRVSRLCLFLPALLARRG